MHDRTQDSGKHTAAESRRGPDGRAGGNADDNSVLVVMGALERLAGATDQLASQVMQRLDRVRDDLVEGGGEADQKLRDRITAIHEEIVGRVQHLEGQVDRGLTELRQRLEVAPTGGGRDGTLRSALAEGLDGLTREIERISASQTGKLDHQFAATQQRAEAGFERVIQAMQDAAQQRMGATQALQESLKDQMRTMAEGLQMARGAWEQRIDAVATALASTLDSRLAGVESTVRTSLAELQQGWARRLDETIQRQTQVHEQSQEHMSRAEAVLARFEEQSQQRLRDFESRVTGWHDSQQARMQRIEEQSRDLTSMGQRLDQSHQEMLRFLQESKERAAEDQKQKQHDEARRVNNAGVSSYHAGEHEAALKLFERAIDLDKRFAEAFNNLGLCYTELGRHEEATAAFESAVELAPDLGAIYNNLGYSLYLQSNYIAAVEMYKEAIGRSADSSAAYTNLGNAYHKLGETEKAVDAWKRAIEVDPGNERAAGYLERVTAGVARPGPAPR